ncbi:hypothetical protein HXT54_05230 [Gardnerella sp. KA00603]|uniref:coiled-coil domain-containing protein n=1 Tax=Gardnerella sp. KA00603 TaxID=2749076 RepID=UPI003BAD4672
MLNKKAIAAFAAAATLVSGLALAVPAASTVFAVQSQSSTNPSTNVQQNDGAISDADFEKAQAEADKKAENTFSLKQKAEDNVKALQEKVKNATGDDKLKLQEQLDNAQKIADAFKVLNDKAVSLVRAYANAEKIRNSVKDIEADVKNTQARLDKLTKNSAAYNNAAEELKGLQGQLKTVPDLLKEANEGITKAKEELVKQEKQTKELQQEHETPEHKNPEHKNPEVAPEHKNPEHKTPEHENPEVAPEHENPEVAPEHKNPAPKPVTPVTPHRDNPSVTPSVTPSDDTPSVTTPSADVPSATTTSSAPASTPAATTPHAGIPAAPASVADLLPGLKGMLTVGANNVAVAGAVNRVTLNISNNQTVIDWLNSNHHDRAYAFIYSSPRLLKGVNGADYMTVTRTANGKLQFDVMFPAGYSGKHTVVFVDDKGNQLGWTNITVTNGTAAQGEGLPKTGVGIALIVLTASVLAGAGAAFRKIRS